MNKLKKLKCLAVFFIAIFNLLFLSNVILAKEMSLTDKALRYKNSLGLKYTMRTEGNIQNLDWEITLDFSAPVNEADIYKYVKLTENGKRKKINVLNCRYAGYPLSYKLSKVRKRYIIAPLVNSKDKANCKVVVSKKLHSANKKLKLYTSEVIKFKTSSKVRLVKYYSYFNSKNDKGLKILLSDVVSKRQLRSKITVFPPIGYFSVNKEYGNRNCTYKIKGNFVTGKTYKISIAKIVTSNKRILDAQKLNFLAKGPEPRISFDVDRSVVELKSKQLIPLSFRNVGNFKCDYIKIPAIYIDDFDGLTEFKSYEEKRPTSTSERRLSETRIKALNKEAENLDAKIELKKKQLQKLRPLFVGDSFSKFLPFLNSSFSKETEAFIGSDDRDKDYYFSIPLDSRPEPEKGGALILRVSENVTNNPQKAVRLFQISDLSITYKFCKNDLLIWVTSTEKGTPVANVAIIVGIKDNRKILAGKTNADGILVLHQGETFSALKWNGNDPELYSESLNITDARTVLAATDNDNAYIRLNTNRFVPAYVKQSTPGMSGKLSAKSKLFTERGVYRQGEKVYWKAIVREFKNKHIIPPSGEKVRVEITDSRGNYIYDENRNLNDYGTCSGEIKLAGYAPLGRYQITLSHEVPLTSADGSSEADWNFLLNKKVTKSKTEKIKKSSKTRTVTLVSTGFEVQQFEPPRHFVSFSMKPETRVIEEIVGRKAKQKYLSCKVKGLYYTGGPVKHAKVQWTAYLVGHKQTIPKYSQYHFGNNDDKKILIESGNSILDKNGELELAFPLSDSILSGMNSIKISATVLDVDGKPATGVKTYEPKPEVNVGISKLPGSLVQGQEFPLHVIALDKALNTFKTGVIVVDIMKKRWFYTQKRDAEGGIYYSWENGWVRTQSVKQQISSDGSAQFDLVLADNGDYLVKATYEQAEQNYKAAYSFTVGSSYESFEDQDGRRRTRSENELVLMPDKDVVSTNDSVSFHYSLPRPAKFALITKETDKIISYRVIRLNSLQGSFSEQITDDCVPNVYISFIAPGMRSSFPVYNSQVDSDYPRAYFAVTNIKVQNKVDRLKIAIMPENKTELRAHPGDQYNLKINVKDSAGKAAKCEVALCVVDEAILSLTGYSTPKLGVLTDFILPLSVFTGDLRTSLISQELYKLISTRLLSGGGMGGGAINADMDIRKDFRPVAYWNAALETDNQGNIQVSFKLPDKTTSYRVYAVAIDKKAAYDSSERQLKVTKEFYLSPGLPRFLTAGDSAKFPLSLCNKTEKTGKAELSICEGKNVTLKPESTGAFMGSQSNSIISTSIRADNGEGEAKLTFGGSFNGYKDAIEKKLPILPSNPIINASKFGHFSGKKTLDIKYPDNLEDALKGVLTNSLTARLTLSTTNWSKIAPSLRYLMRYPYGCVEQTSSGIIPLVALRKLIKNGDLPGFNIDAVDEFLNAGIARLSKMQTYSGGFAYWMGDTEPSWWGSQYAVFALTLARKNGMNVDKTVLDNALSYIRKNLFTRKSDSVYRHGFMALSLVNLAMNKKLSSKDLKGIGTKRFPLSEKETLPLLLWTDTLIGASSAKNIKKALKYINVDDSDNNHGWYSSSSRANAFALLACMNGHADKKAVDELASELLNAIKPDGRLTSTADTGIALYALASYFEKNKTSNKENVNVEVKIGDKTTSVNTGKHGATIELDAKSLLHEQKMVLKAEGKTLVNWTLAYTYPDFNSTVANVDKGFDVTKRIQNLNGKKVIRVGDLVKVTVEFEDDFSQNGKSQRYEYVALEDSVPAGLLPVNPALKNENIQRNDDNDDDPWYGSWDNGAYTLSPDSFEIHNDKVMVFKNKLWSNRYRYTYYARAICEGSFRMKPTKVSLMYKPNVYGQTKSKVVHILPIK